MILDSQSPELGENEFLPVKSPSHGILSLQPALTNTLCVLRDALAFLQENLPQINKTISNQEYSIVTPGQVQYDSSPQTFWHQGPFFPWTVVGGTEGRAQIGGIRRQSSGELPLWPGSGPQPGSWGPTQYKTNSKEEDSGSQMT